ncbi:MAG: 3-oxoacyl-ACP synthase III [Planctomycetaceae bacterium]|nr:3-oxoacyl-ACP synthase III [Planctomycetaceae bacterium]
MRKSDAISQPILNSGSRYQHVCLETAVCTIPPHVLTSEEIESRLAPVYDRLGLPAGRLEMMTGIQERRFFDPGTKPGSISALTVHKAVQDSQLDPDLFGALIHGSVCRDQMEPATATGVHAASGLPQSALVFDVSNACLGILNGVQIIAEMIEAGRIEAGVVVGTEVGRSLVEGTIDSLLQDTDVDRKRVKSDFASLTIGSGSAAIVLCHERHSQFGHKLLGGSWLADTTNNHLCQGGDNSDWSRDSRPRMNTDSEGLLNAGVALAEKTWTIFRRLMEWTNSDIQRVFTHQVGKAHRSLLMKSLGLEPDLDFPTVERFGNTGAAALPMALALGMESGFLNTGDRAALLGIGSGLNSLMYGLEW